MTPNPPKFWTTIWKQWFLLALASVLTVGVLGADILAPLNSFTGPRTLMVCLVMGLMALPIPFELIRRSISRPWPAFLASIINMAVIPLMAWAAAKSLSIDLGGGLIVAATIPCTLASAAVWTRRAGGDDTVAILVTLLTNLICVVVTPLWLVLLLGRTVQLRVESLIVELILVVLLPIGIAQVLRLNRRVAGWSEKNKMGLSIACQIGILCMVLFGAIQMGQRLSPGTNSPSESPLTLVQIAWTTVLAAAIHLLAMALGWYLAARTGIAREQQIAVAISGSQKTLMIGLKLAMDCGVSILPMVVYHVGQLLLDTLIADRWRRKS